MANESSSRFRLGTLIFLLVIALFGSVLATISTVALVQTRAELRRVRTAQFAADRWRVETPPIVPNGNGEVQRLQAENMALRSQLAQMQSQFRNMEVSRPVVRSYSSSPWTVLNSSGFRNTGADQPPRNKEQQDKFLAENKAKPGVVTLPSGLQYKVIWTGYGRTPQANEYVSLNYRGTLIDGTEIDNSYSRSEPMEFSMSGIIKGWKEALLLMPAGAKWQLFVPSELAYGDRGLSRRIPANAALIYEIELVSIRDRNTSASPPAFISGPDAAQLLRFEPQVRMLDEQ